MLNQNTLTAKFLRQITALLEVSKYRQGHCVQCGTCCKLPFVCPMLRVNDKGHARCSIYRLRPQSCRKYPRTETECLTKDACGFRFAPKPHRRRSQKKS